MKNVAPTIFVIFGGTGDLAQRKLIPALIDLFSREFLPERYHILGFSRREFTEDGFKEFMRVAIDNKEHAHSKETIERFLTNISYITGDFSEASAYKAIAEELKIIDDKFGMCSNKLFYLAVPPNFYEGIFKNLASSGLTIPCGGDEGWTRVLVEKPFGRDFNTAAKLDTMLGKLFKEEQIFRIDHYLAKESLQNILMFRFSNALFEPVWSKDHIDKVEIRFHEAIGIEGRGEFYEDIGALRDVGQNHMLQMLAIIAMERPDELGAKAIRSRRARVLASLDPIIEKDVIDLTIRGQFKGYKDEADVAVDSQTETYFRLTANINNDRWDGVPFVLESGKQMKNTVNEMVITFKEKGMCLCPPEQHSSHANKLSFRIQPDEGISILFWAKKPGFEFGLEQKDLSFKYTDSPDSQALPDAYERVLYDCIRGDQTLFASTEEIAASWTFISPILEGWKNAELIVYDKGTDGPQK